jgi:hypothetical protein
MDKIVDLSINYSDHSAVEAEFDIIENDYQIATNVQSEVQSKKSTIYETNQIFTKGIEVK